VHPSQYVESTHLTLSFASAPSLAPGGAATFHTAICRWKPSGRLESSV